MENVVVCEINDIEIVGEDVYVILEVFGMFNRKVEIIEIGYENFKIISSTLEVMKVSK